MAFLQNYKLIEIDAIDSTNLEAKRLIQKGGFHGNFVISAKTQTAGRGRLDRQWISKEGNLFLSIVTGEEKREKGEEPNNSSTVTSPLPLLPFIAALAVGDSLAPFISSKKIKYKWPNDVLVDGRKISGILIEIINNHAIIGVGINIAHHPESDIKFPATCLNDHSQNLVTANEILEGLVKNLDKRLQSQRNEILNDWIAQAHGINTNVTMAQENKAISGVYRGIDENGRLILETDGGKRELVLYGDVIF